MRVTKRLAWLFLALAAGVAGVVAVVLRQRVSTEQVTAGQMTQPGYRQTPLWQIYDWAAEKLDRSFGWEYY